MPLIRAAALPNGGDIAGLVAKVREGDADAAKDLGVRVRESGACDKVRILARAETDRALSELAQVPRCAASEALADVARGLAARVT